MKAYLLLLLLPSLTVASNEKYVQTMTKNIDLVYKAKTLEELQVAVNAFERIAGAEKTQWEPYYYSAFGRVMMALKETEGSRKDSQLDLALDAISKGTGLAPAESELAALEGFVHMIRVTVDPAARGQQYSSKAYEAYGKALQLNPANPRALALQAQMDFGTAQFFHASTAGACEANNKAIPLFTAPTNPLAPSWGQSMALEMKSRCEAGK